MLFPNKNDILHDTKWLVKSRWIYPTRKPSASRWVLKLASISSQCPCGVLSQHATGGGAFAWAKLSWNIAERHMPWMHFTLTRDPCHWKHAVSSSQDSRYLDAAQHNDDEKKRTGRSPKMQRFNRWSFPFAGIHYRDGRSSFAQSRRGSGVWVRGPGLGNRRLGPWGPQRKVWPQNTFSAENCIILETWERTLGSGPTCVRLHYRFPLRRNTICNCQWVNKKMSLHSVHKRRTCSTDSSHWWMDFWRSYQH